MTMEQKEIEILLIKYFEGQTTIEEEKKIKTYFSSNKIAEVHKQYQSLFNYIQEEQKTTYKSITKNSNYRLNFNQIAIAASFLLALGIGSVIYINQKSNIVKEDLGTYDNPEIAFKETQKVLNLLSSNINVGIKSVEVINEYENAKNRIFTETN